MTLYHYTCLEHLRQILADGIIKTTHSNLLRPVNPRFINGVFADPETDSYKPVVWLTSTLDFSAGEGNGLTGSVYDKTECAIAIEVMFYHHFRKWDEWTKENKADKEWIARLKATAPNWRSWYISEKPIVMDSATNIIFRSDILAELKEQDEAT